MDLQNLNTATKYPSILTMHGLGPRGGATEEILVDPFAPGFVATEKLDGTNSRLIVMPDGDWFIGSRNDLLTARGDRVPNPAMGLVETVIRLAPRLRPLDGMVTVYFGEVYGGATTAAGKIYGALAFRLFDVALIAPDALVGDAASIAKWREAGGQTFLHLDRLAAVAKEMDLPTVPPVACEAPQSKHPGIVKAWLTATCLRTAVGNGPSEGVVVRTPDRSIIAKIRHDDYRKV